MGVAPAEKRFWAKTATNETGCIVWVGGISAKGYGRFVVNSRRVTAHRWIYERTVGPVPDGIVLDHLCRVRSCVNVAHLEAVSNRENIVRGVGATARNLRKTHCKNGHEFTPENTRYKRRYKRSAYHGRICRICARKWRRS